ncbi:uncharacterized protein PV06_05087 [Exophiala oligosperma]|uniref:Major facilitator superfamily (MFS) profile domain-containing protein n=1 Tax=Exophiala oligosperma TaxID=215243 RepID=A0A0D2AW99_9EURO|nr:uncharacterized protein PV06_05087 [Exophiala oligosperma]KIW44046.1 hypothetical protein PV06_05087 [Exophiala oligosperma]
MGGSTGVENVSKTDSGVDLEESSPTSPAIVDNKNEATVDNEAIQRTVLKASNVRQIIIVLAGFTVTAMTCSIVFAFGVYQALYEDMSQNPDTPFTSTSSAEIGLIGTLALSLMTLGGPFAMTWAKLFSPQIVIGAGGVVFGIAFVLASFSQQPWQFALTQGLLAGVGTCMSYVPTTAVVPTWFDKRRAFAMGVTISGTGVGGMFWPPVLRALITHVGFRNAMRISGCTCAVLVVAAGCALPFEPGFRGRMQLTVPTPTPTAGFTTTAATTTTTNRSTRSSSARTILRRMTTLPKLDSGVATSRKFVAQALANFVQAAGYSTPLFFYAAYAQSRGFGADAAANFITLSNASNFVSRIMIGYAADRLGRLNALFVTTVLTAITVLGFWLPSTFCDVNHDAHGDNGNTCDTDEANVLFFIFTVLYGSFASAYISLFPACLLELFGHRHFTAVSGSLYLVRGAGALVGTPLTGLLIPRATALTQATTYTRAAVTVGALMSAAAVFTAWARVEAQFGTDMNAGAQSTRAQDTSTRTNKWKRKWKA